MATANPAVPTRSLTFPGVLWRGLAAGAAAGLAAGLVSLLVVERPLKAALAVEAAREHAGEHHEELFSRTTQVIGGMVAELVVAVAIGLVFAVAFARTRHRLPAATDFGRSALLAATGFAAIALLPALKYPANPPLVGDPDTITQRSLYYLAFIGAMLVVAYLAFVARERLVNLAPAYRVSAVVAGTAVVVTVLAIVFPASPDSIPADLPATVLWQFRLASLGLLATLWAVLGVVFGLLVTKREAR
jgi:predicted cobalt transporter CbtA